MLLAKVYVELKMSELQKQLNTTIPTKHTRLNNRYTEGKITVTDYSLACDKLRRASRKHSEYLEVLDGLPESLEEMFRVVYDDLTADIPGLINLSPIDRCVAASNKELMRLNRGYRGRGYLIDLYNHF